MASKARVDIADDQLPSSIAKLMKDLDLNGQAYAHGGGKFTYEIATGNFFITNFKLKKLGNHKQLHGIGSTPNGKAIRITFKEA